MSRFLPKSLLGQTLLAVAFALLTAQIISASLLFRAAQERTAERTAERLANRLITGQVQYRMSALEGGFKPDEVRRPRDAGLSPRDRRLPRQFQFRFADTLEKTPTDRRLPKVEQALREKLAEQRPNRSITDIYVASRPQGSDPVVVAGFRSANIEPDQIAFPNRLILIASVSFENNGSWQEARVRLPKNQPRPLPGILLQTAVLFIVLMGLLYFLLRRITRPLADLTERVSAFSRNPDAPVPMDETGPQDTRQLIAAHNAMEARVAALLDEKDVMLGAIGHDLKTPLAALRVRVESVEDAAQRGKMAASIEDITHTLDDILSLARIGRSRVEFERVDLSALTASVVEEFEDLGKPVALGANPRIVREVQVTWLKRALRNLVSNAVRYGGNAEVSLHENGDAAILRVDDNGPGIAPDQIEQMLEPFQRGEASRNRATGGAGLGLTLARAIAEQHAGTLVLVNREEDGQIVGLRAEIRIPADS